MKQGLVYRIVKAAVLACATFCLVGCAILDGIFVVARDDWERNTGLRWPEERLSVSEYVFYDLGPGSARAVNTFLRVVGERADTGAFWELNPTTDLFEYLQLQQMNETLSESLAYSINSDGQIVGEARGRFQRIVSIWPSAESDPYTVDSTSPSFLLSVSEQGVAVGTSKSGGPVDPRFEVNSASRWDLASPSGWGSSSDIYTGRIDRDWAHMTVATDLTNARLENEIIVGYSINSRGGDERAWVRTRLRTGGGMPNRRFITTLEDRWRPQAVNDHGWIVGGSIDTGLGHFAKFDIERRPSRGYRPDTGRLLPLPSDVGERRGTMAYAVDNQDPPSIVGESRGRAVIWTEPAAIPFDLSRNAPEGWILHKAYGINNLGIIVGEGSFEGQIRAFLLSPFEFERY